MSQGWTQPAWDFDDHGKVDTKIINVWGWLRDAASELPDTSTEAD